ncbi:hypothetical protein [Acetobacterium bakii]|uniref:Uncharacterized protein n=2 Tax=Acetobacterium bakii TaxID=52689 RepID=A0A0L6U3R2_9FIRM|nr:hypothetical protein [Acetobacterium bakii]KNZ42415.1 hypothetical protein AKG39_06520 [Acetobacterium bakii]
MKSNVTALVTWLSKTNLKQRMILGVGGFLMIGMIGLGIYTLLPKDTANPNTTSSDKTVKVQDINTAQTKAVTSAPAETKVVEVQAVTDDSSTVVESNVTTVETPALESEPVYTSEETGGRYEAPQEETVAVSEPTYSEPVASTEPEPAASSGGGWNGDFEGTAGDNTGWENGGTGISN